MKSAAWQKGENKRYRKIAEYNPGVYQPSVSLDEVVKNTLTHQCQQVQPCNQQKEKDGYAFEVQHLSFRNQDQTMMHASEIVVNKNIIDCAADFLVRFGFIIVIRIQVEDFRHFPGFKDQHGQAKGKRG